MNRWHDRLQQLKGPVGTPDSGIAHPCSECSNVQNQISSEQSNNLNKGGEEYILDGDDLRHRYEERAGICEFDGHQDRPRAESRAWHEVAAIWYRQHGNKTPDHICAGCGKPLGDSDVVWVMPGGERAHAGTVQRCIIAYGRRWKTEAADALMAIGIPSPPKLMEESKHGIKK